MALATYLVSMQKQGMLIPADAVAEVIPYEPLQRLDETPDWFLGLLGWRGVQIPVASFEMLTVLRASFSLVSVASATLVVVRGLRQPDTLPFYALVGQTTPRLIELEEEMLFPVQEEVLKTELEKVRFEDQLLSVPDLDFVEASIEMVLNR